jgi:hypothetical protein
MSYNMPGMEYYPMVIDAPSAGSDLPSGPSSILAGTGLSGSMSYNASFDVGTAILIFAVLWFGSVGALHALSNVADRV